VAAGHYRANLDELAMIEAKKDVDILDSRCFIASVHAVVVLFQSIFTATSIVHR
jgi:hypothetical protein